MKTLNSEKTREIFAEFQLSCDEMLKVRGGRTGQSEPTVLPPVPPIKI